MFLVPWQMLGIVLAVFCLTKGKRFTGIVGLFIPLVAVIGAVRLAADTDSGSVAENRKGE